MFESERIGNQDVGWNKSWTFFAPTSVELISTRVSSSRFFPRLTNTVTGLFDFVNSRFDNSFCRNYFVDSLEFIEQNTHSKNRRGEIARVANWKFTVLDILSSCEGSSPQGSRTCHTLLSVNITTLVLTRVKAQKLVKIMQTLNWKGTTCSMSQSINQSTIISSVWYNTINSLLLFVLQYICVVSFDHRFHQFRHSYCYRVSCYLVPCTPQVI